MTIHQDMGERNSKRTRVLLSASITSPSGSQTVLMRDISHHGAQVYAASGVQEGHDACFRMGPIFVAACIVWCRNGMAGLKFYRALTSSEHAAALNSVVTD